MGEINELEERRYRMKQILPPILDLLIPLPKQLFRPPVQAPYFERERSKKEGPTIPMPPAPIPPVNPEPTVTSNATEVKWK
jgi:hypothetical protein